MISDEYITINHTTTSPEARLFLLVTDNTIKELMRLTPDNKIIIQGSIIESVEEITFFIESLEMVRDKVFHSK